MLSKLLNSIIKYKTVILLVFLLIISGVAHGYNMFHYPYYENDEGTYISQAWSLLKFGKLAPYTYWYDHAPAGWIFIAFWSKLTGGFFTFGTSVNSGRVFMLILHLLSSTLLFIISKRISKSNLAAAITILIFSFSPLAIYFQRRVLLDNIMVFWILLSLSYLLKENNRLSQIMLSAMFFGIAVLTKENAVFFIPAFLYIIFSKVNKNVRYTVIIKWLLITGFTISFYLIYALLKGELLPSGFNGDTRPHVSLIKTLVEQSNRGQSFGLFDKRSDFYGNLIEWLNKDKLTISLGFLATLLNLIYALKAKIPRAAILLVISFSLFLIRGKLVIDFYIIPLIPFLALNIGILVGDFVKIFSYRKRLLYYFLAIFVFVSISIYQINSGRILYSKDETSNQINTINWIKNNIPTDSKFVIDDSIYVDLHEQRFQGDPVFPNAEWAWKVEMDEEIKNGKFNNDWKSIDYIILSHEILRQIRLFHHDFLINAFNHSKEITKFSKDSTSFTDINNLISTNGDWMAIYKLNDPSQIILNDSWNYYKENFIKSYGQVVDPQQKNNTTSEGQSYAMLRAVYENDQNTFDGVWSWTKDHMQYRSGDKLLSWLWINNGDNSKLGDSESASDADEDIALSLLFAYKKWGNNNYLTESKKIINDIWKKEVVNIKGVYYLTSGSNSSRKEGYLLNPSYISPATYRIFAEVDKAHPWIQLSSDSYLTLNKLGLLPPNWLLIDKKSEVFKSASNYIKDVNANDYGYDAFRTFWRVALDAKWFNNEDAKIYLEDKNVFFENEWKNNNNIYSVYNTKGKNISTFGSLSNSVGALSVFNITNKNMEHEIYLNLYKSQYNYAEGYWAEKDNYYTQNWAWFATLMNSDKMNNLW